MANLMKPVVNINGTSKDALINARLDARLAIKEAMEKLYETKPHGRDYQTLRDSKERYNTDLEIYAARFHSLEKLYNELLEEATAIKYGDK